VPDLGQFAADLADFLAALYQIDPSGGPVGGQHSCFRGGPLAVWDTQARDAIAALDGEIDTDRASEVWEAGLSATWQGPPDEVGALAARAGYTAAFEDRVCPTAPPSDVVLRRGEQVIRTETVAIMRDKQTQEADAFWHRISIMIKRIEWRYDTPISGTISGRLGDEESAELLRLARGSRPASDRDQQRTAGLLAAGQVAGSAARKHGLRTGVRN